jgi:hypothetical protein
LYIAESDLLLAILARADQRCLPPPDVLQCQFQAWRILLPFAEPRRFLARPGLGCRGNRRD